MSRRLTTFIPTLIICASACAVLFGGCTKRELTDRETVVMALSAPPSTLDPRFATDATGERMAGLLFSSLVRTGDDLKPAIGDATESWTVKNGVDYTFKIRPGLKFSNGRPVDGDDIRFSFESVKDAKSPFKSSFAIIKEIEAQYDVTKGGTVRIVLRKPSAIFLGDLRVLKFLPKAEVLANDADYAAHPIGSGPFALESVGANDIVFAARADHPSAAPKIKRAIFKIVRDDNTRALKMKRGEIDLAQAEFPPLKVRWLEKEPKLKVYAYPGLAMTYMLVNHRDPLLSKLGLRKALAAAVDRDSITKYKLEGLATPASSLLTPANPFFNSALKPPLHSPIEAKRLIAALGLEGRAFELKTSNSPTAVDNGRIVARQLSDAGLKISTRSFEWATFYSDIQNGRFQLAIMRWTGTIDPDLYRKAMATTEVPPAGRNRGAFSNPRLDALVDSGLSTEDFTTRKKIYDEVQEIAFGELAVVPLWYDTEVAVASTRLKNYVPPLDGSYWPLTQVTKE
ncbi:MAG: ABC transporter substrate-binding protein [Bdellovibrionota bacterium]